MKNLVVLSGPRAVGKSTLARKLLEKRPDFSYLVKATTRERRSNEENGEYLFVTDDDFEQKVIDKKILFPHIGWEGMYGVSSSSFFIEGNKVVCINDLFTVYLLRRKEFVIKENFFEDGRLMELSPRYTSEYEKVLSIYVDGDEKELSYRLEKRQKVNDSKKNIFRLFNLTLNLSYGYNPSFFDYTFRNDNLGEASSELMEIVNREIA